MDKKAWKSPSKDSLKDAYNNRGKYPDQNNRRYIFTSSGNEKVWNVKDKSHKVRLLPVHPVDNINFYGMTVHVHTNVGVNGDQFLCPKRMKNMNCPICEHQTALWDTEPDMAKDLYPQTRYLVWMVDLEYGALGGIALAGSVSRMDRARSWPPSSASAWARNCWPVSAQPQHPQARLQHGRGSNNEHHAHWRI